MDEILGIGKLFLKWTSNCEVKQFEMAAVVVAVIILVGVIVEIVGFIGVDFVLVIIAWKAIDIRMQAVSYSFGGIIGKIPAVHKS